MFNPQALMITGGAGFIGSHLVRRLRRDYGYCGTLVVVDLETYAADRSRLTEVESSIRYVREDICDTEAMRAIIADEHIDAIINLAAESHVDRSIEAPTPFVTTNIAGTYSLLEAARGCWVGRTDVRFYQISTDEVFGALQAGDPLFTESSPYAPRSPYAASKAAADHLVRSYYHTYGLPVLISSCSNNYGPDQHAEKLIPKAITGFLAGRTVPLYGDGLHVRDWIYVSDHTDAIYQILRTGTPGSSYVAGTGVLTGNRMLLEMIITLLAPRLHCEEAALRSLIAAVPDRPGHDRGYGIDASRLHHDLGWSARISLSEGLALTIDHMIGVHTH